MKRKSVVIVGGGPGGLMTANHLARSLRGEIGRGEVAVTVLTASDRHVYEAGYLFMALALKEPEQFTRPQKDLVLPGVTLVVDPAAGIDTAARAVTGKSGRKYGYDVLLLATGSVPRPDLTPGFAEAGLDFYTAEGTARCRDALAAFEGGRILCAVEMPHKCPVAFLEILFLLRDHYRRKGIGDRVELAYTYPLDGLHQQPPIAEFVRPLLAEAGIACHTGFAVDRADPASKTVVARDGREVGFDLLLTIPTHRAPAVILEAGLGDAQGWIDVDPFTLQARGLDDVFALGDATNLHTRRVSKAGSAAHYQAEVVARNIERRLRGLAPEAGYDGKVFCFLETGLDEASCIQMDYDHPPKPPPPSKLLHWFKLSFNELYWAAVRGVF